MMMGAIRSVGWQYQPEFNNKQQKRYLLRDVDSRRLRYCHGSGLRI